MEAHNEWGLTILGMAGGKSDARQMRDSSGSSAR